MALDTISLSEDVESALWQFGAVLFSLSVLDGFAWLRKGVQSTLQDFQYPKERLEVGKPQLTDTCFQFGGPVGEWPLVT